MVKILTAGFLLGSMTLGFGPGQVWRPSAAAIHDLHRCTAPIRPECVRKVMDQHGASKDAFEFYHLTGWFLVEIVDIKDAGGPVKLASILNPWRANENTQPALIGGNPMIVYPEDVQTPVESDVAFKALKTDFPQLMFWKSGPTLEGSTTTSAGQAFVFRYRLLDGCHACAIRGWARVAFDFASDGTYQSTGLLGIERH